MKKLKVIYEDKNILAIDKPSGLMVHGDGKTKERTLTDEILKKYPKIKNVGEPMKMVLKGGKEKIIYRPGIVHRLDKETSGILVVAKNQETFLNLKEQFKGRTVKKIYRAIVHGSVTDDRGIIDRPLGRSPKDFRQWSAHTTARGEKREAVTEYKVIKRFKDKVGSFSYLEVYPKTGRTHQIRAHLKFINHPIVCDDIYSGKRGCALGLKRLALHSLSISLTLPSGKRASFVSDLPKEFSKAVPA